MKETLVRKIVILVNVNIVSSVVNFLITTLYCLLRSQLLATKNWIYRYQHQSIRCYI